MKQEILKRDNFTCKKCGFRGKETELEIHHIIPKFEGGKDMIENLVTLCSICHKHAPDKGIEFKKYLKEKIDWKILDTFRKSDYSISRRTKKGMANTVKKENIFLKLQKVIN